MNLIRSQQVVDGVSWVWLEMGAEEMAGTLSMGACRRYTQIRYEFFHCLLATTYYLAPQPIFQQRTGAFAITALSHTHYNNFSASLVPFTLAATFLNATSLASSGPPCFGLTSIENGLNPQSSVLPN